MHFLGQITLFKVQPEIIVAMIPEVTINEKILFFIHTNVD